MKNTLKLFIGMLLFIVLSIGNLMSAESCEGFDLPYCCDGSPSYDPCNGETPSGETPSGETPKECPDGCCGIKLNTNFPIIGNCIETKNGAGTNPTTAFPTMIGALTKIIMSLILVVCFIFIIIAGIIRAGAGEDTGKVKTAQKYITKVAITILLLGFSGLILRLINPNFFG